MVQVVNSRALCPLPPVKLPPMKVNPSMIDPAEPVRSSSVSVVTTSGVTTDSSGVTRPRASTPACAPSNVRFLASTTFSMYVPGQTLIVSPELAAPTAALIMLNVGVVSLQSVVLAIPSSSTTRVIAATELLPRGTKLTSSARRANTSSLRIIVNPSFSLPVMQKGAGNFSIVVKQQRTYRRCRLERHHLLSRRVSSKAPRSADH